jgi:hypothetical protein
MRTRPGPFYVMEIARAVARQPGRAEVDLDEAYRITDDIAEWYLRGEFGDDEVAAYAGPPPELRSLAEIKEDAQRRGENWRLSQPEWRACYMLTAPATRRYLRGCGLAGAPRVLRQWLPRKGTHRKPGPKPEKRNAIADRMFDELRLKQRTPDELEGDKLVALAAKYGGSPNTANHARKDALERFAKISKIKL